MTAENLPRRGDGRGGSDKVPGRDIIEVKRAHKSIQKENKKVAVWPEEVKFGRNKLVTHVKAAITPFLSGPETRRTAWDI